MISSLPGGRLFGAGPRIRPIRVGLAFAVDPATPSERFSWKPPCTLGFTEQAWAAIAEKFQSMNSQCTNRFTLRMPRNPGGQISRGAVRVQLLLCRHRLHQGNRALAAAAGLGEAPHSPPWPLFGRGALKRGPLSLACIFSTNSRTIATTQGYLWVEPLGMG